MFEEELNLDELEMATAGNSNYIEQVKQEINRLRQDLTKTSNSHERLVIYNKIEELEAELENMNKLNNKAI